MVSQQLRRVDSHKKRSGFTLTELIVVVVVIAVLMAITIVTYNGSQRRAMDVQVQQTVSDARKSLQVYYAFNSNYPPNIANTEYAPPLTVAVVLYTNAPQMPIYDNLTPDQNAQLFLNACNGFMPIVSGGLPTTPLVYLMAIMSMSRAKWGRTS